ncbi:DUF2490 domain-containing protein [Rufibacter soli]|jgi:hypothetical protein
MKSFICLLGISVCLLLAQEAEGQPNSFNHWLQYSGSYWLNPQWNLTAHLQYRTYKPVTDLRATFSGAEAQHVFKDLPVAVAVGYTHLLNRTYLTPEETAYTHENRLYQQITVKGQVGRVALSHRYQVEERWLPQGYHTRLRYLLGLRVPLKPDADGKSAWYGILRNEVRVIIRDQPFDSNRVYGGLGYVFNKHLTLEGMWLSQLVGIGKHQHFSVFILKHDFGKME